MPQPNVRAEFPLSEESSGGEVSPLEILVVSRGTERRYGAGGEDGNFVAASNDGVPRCPSRTT
jgi:hypothetical protein